MAYTEPEPSAGAFAKIKRFFGFSKGYNLIFAFLALGYLGGFTLARLQYFSYYGIFCGTSSSGNSAAPGECYFYLKNPYKIGMMLHLFCILPAALLACLQFVPIIRYKAILFHRINGYVIIILSIVSSAGTIIVAPHAFGGDMAIRSFVGVLVISTTMAYLLAYINIKRLQIDQHRAWMIRAWAYFGTIVTIRLIMFISSQIISGRRDLSVVRPCAQIDSVLGRSGTLAHYPGCQAYYHGDTTTRAIVLPDFNSNDPLEIAASLGVGFGAAGWIGLWLHAVAVELLSYT